MKKWGYIILIIFSWLQLAFPQPNGEKSELEEIYESLKDEFIFVMHKKSSVQDTAQIMDFLKMIEQSGEWETGILFLQNLLTTPEGSGAEPEQPNDPQYNNNFGKKRTEKQNSSTARPFKFYLGTGIDYSLNSFEVLNLDQDSLLQSKITSPSIRAGFDFFMDSFWIPFELNSNFSYDQLLTNVFSQFKIRPNLFYIPYIKYSVNRVISNDTANYNFCENKIEIGKDWTISAYQINLMTYYRKKQYDKDTEITPSYESLFFTTSIQKSSEFFLHQKGVEVEYFQTRKLHFDESESYVYTEGNFPFSWKSGQMISQLSYLQGKYRYIYSDQILKNQYQDIGINFDVKQKIRDWFSFRWKSEAFLRKYAEQNEYETDFYYWKEKIGIETNVLNEINNIWVYYINEQEIHYTPADSFDIDDYNSNGIGINLFISFSRLNIYLDYEYLNKKTPSNIYDFVSYNQPSANQNIIASLSWNLGHNFSLNGNISFLHTRNLREKNTFLTNYMNLELLYSF